jgi:hypothetical protein
VVEAVEPQQGWQQGLAGLDTCAAPMISSPAAHSTLLAFLNVARVMTGVSTASMLSPMFSNSTV